MRRTLAATCLSLIAVGAAQSQAASPASAISKGSMLVAGSARISRVESDGGGASTTIGVAPNVLYFVMDRFAIGGELSLSRTSSEGFTSTSWSLGPAARYFFAEPGARTLPFVGGAMTTGRAKTNSGGADFEGSTTEAEIGVGITQLLSNQIGLTAEAFYRNARFEATPPPPASAVENRFSEIGVRFGVAAFLF